MKYQILFSLKKKRNKKIKMLSAAFMLSALRVKGKYIVETNCIKMSLLLKKTKQKKTKTNGENLIKIWTKTMFFMFKRFKMAAIE